ncbi:MAG: RNA methyltransferase [Bacilli bacterium]|nr:RNA methyltransferase [Bacilli bacterium]
MEITSLNNAKVKYWAKLYDKKFRDNENKFIVEGDHLIEEALKNNVLLEIITTLNKEFSVDTYQVTSDIMKKISNQKSAPSIIGICQKLSEKEIYGNVLILDEIQDPGNLGTIIRSSIAFDFKTIILVNNCVDLYNEKVIRSSEGMIFYSNVIRSDVKNCVEQLKQNNYMIYGTSLNNGVSIKNIAKNEKVAIIIGNEGKGMSKECQSICDKFITLTMNPACESLNAGVAASIIMHEIYDKE